MTTSLLGAAGGGGADLTATLGNSQVLVYSDFVNSGDTSFASVTGGTGASVTINGNAGDSFHTNPGVAICSTGTTTGGYGGLNLSPNYFCIGGGTITMECVFRLPVLSDATDSYYYHFGIMNGVTSTSKSCWMRYSHIANSGKWECINEGSGVEAIEYSNSAIAANTWTKIKIVINAGATSAEFFVDDTSIATNTGALPGTTISDICGFKTFIKKFAGTTARTVEIDYIKFLIDLTTER